MTKLDVRDLEAIVRRDFPAFLEKAFAQVHPGKPFHRNWHIDAVAHHLDRVRKGFTRRLIINQPPRSLKSITVSVAYVAFLLAQDPSMRIIVVSYNGKFANELHRQFRMLVESQWFKTTFSNVQWAKQTDNDFVTTVGGGRFATSIGGTLTGRGGDLLIIDDPMNAAKVRSEASRNEVIEFFSGTLLSRLNDQKTQSIIVVMQRLHEADLTGHLLAEVGQWEHLSLPAIAPEDADIPIGYGRIYHRQAGEVLHAAREDRNTLDALKQEMGSLIFSAQYQQAPLPVEGNIIKRQWIEASAYERVPDIKSVTQIVQSWDTAVGTGASNDCSVCTTAMVSPSDAFIIDVWRGRLGFPQLRKKVVELALRYNPDTILIEDVGSGASLLQDLRQSADDGIVRPIGIKPLVSKEDRLAGPSARFEAGMVHLPKSAPWLDVYMLELLGFPGTAHDDQVDSTSQLLNWWWKNWRPRNSVDVVPFIILTAPRANPFDAPFSW